MEKTERRISLDLKTAVAFALLALLVVVVIVVSVLRRDGERMHAVAPTILAAELTSTPQLAYYPTPSPGSPVPTSTRVTRTVTPVPSATPTIKFPPTATPIPESAYLKIIAHAKFYYLGCEAAAAVDLAGYYDVQLYESDFQLALPVSDNPDLGFVGDPNGPWGQVPPYAYGVHAAPVAALLRDYGVDAEGGKGYTLDQMKQKIAAGHPVIAWVIGNMIGGIPAEYTDKAGNTTIVAAYEHVVILTGYDADSIRYVNNGKFYEVPYEVFLNSWGVLGNMAVFHR
jgi:uncharacterized protein YvpB